MNRFSFLTACLLGTWGFLTAGCSTTTVNTAEPAVPTARREMLADQRVQTDASLARAVRVRGINTATDAQGFLKVQIELENTTRSRKQFTYRVQWFDAQGMIINLPTATAVPRALEGREVAYITTTAPTPGAKDFRILFLEPVTK